MTQTKTFQEKLREIKVNNLVSLAGNQHMTLDESTIRQITELVEEVKKVTGETSDGYHTFNELYDYRRVYNATLFNEWAKNGAYQVHKSWKHSDGELAFGGGWFVVVAELPTGQITNHYEEKYWDEFDIPEEPKASEYDGHTPKEALERLKNLRQTQRAKLREKK